MAKERASTNQENENDRLSSREKIREYERLIAEERQKEADRDRMWREEVRAREAEWEKGVKERQTQWENEVREREEARRKERDNESSRDEIRGED
jgi:hypothetical protein